MLQRPSHLLVLPAVATALTGCSLLLDTGDLAGQGAGDASNADGASDDANARDAGGDAAGNEVPDAGDADGTSTGSTLQFDPGSMWPVSTPSTSLTPTTPTFTTSASCTDLIVLANSGTGSGATASATIANSAGLTFTEVVKDSGNSADTIYIWRATNSCATRSGTVTVNWATSSGSFLWANVVVFAFTHSKGIGAVGNAHNPGNTSINTITITPAASGSWLFASLSGNGDNDATSPGTASDYVQEWSSEAAVQSYGPSHTPAPTTLGVPVTFSMTTPDGIWANAAAEVLSL